MVEPRRCMILHWSANKDGCPGERKAESVIVTLGQIFMILGKGGMVESVSPRDISIRKGDQTLIYDGCWMDILLVLALVDFCVFDLGECVATEKAFEDSMAILAVHDEGVDIVCRMGALGQPVASRFALSALRKIAVMLAAGIDDIDVLRVAADKTVALLKDALLECQSQPGRPDLIQKLVAKTLQSKR
jgi:hypothetical protein